MCYLKYVVSALATTVYGTKLWNQSKFSCVSCIVFKEVAIGKCKLEEVFFDKFPFGDLLCCENMFFVLKKERVILLKSFIAIVSQLLILVNVY